MSQSNPILWVVEEPDRLPLARTLQPVDGWEMTWAAGLDEGLRRIQARPFVTIGVSLACVGLEGLRQLRAAAPRMALLGLLDEEDASLERALEEAGADGWLLREELAGPGLARELRRAIALRQTRNALDSSQEQLRQLTIQPSARETGLSAGEQIYRHVFASLGEATFIAHPSGMILSANPAAERMFGWTEEEFRRLGPQGLLDLSDQRIPGAREERIRSGYFSGELRFRRKNGEVFPAVATSVLFCDAAGQQRASVIVRDISELKQGEQALRDAEELYHAIIQASPDGIVFLGMDFKVTLASDKVIDLFGLDSREEAVGLNAVEFIVPEDRERGYKDLYNLFTERHSQNNHYRLIKKDGTIFEGEINGQLLRSTDGQPRGIVAVMRNVTERNRARAALQLRDNLLRMSGEMAHVGGWEFDAQTLDGVWTDEVAGIYDLDAAPSGEMGNRLQFYMGASRERIERAIQGAIERGEPYDLELEITSARGRHKWVRAMGMPVWENGRVVKVHGIFQDISAAVENRRQLEEANAELRASEARFRVLFENRHSVMLVLDPQDGAIVDANPAACQYFGWTLAELLKMKITDIGVQPAAEILASLSHSQTIQDGEQLFFRDRLANGEIRDVEVHRGPIRVGEKTLLFSITFDITERTRAQQALAQSQQRFSRMFQSSPAALVIKTMPDGRLLEVNESFMRLLEYKRVEVIGRSITDLDVYAIPEQRREILEQLARQGYAHDVEVALCSHSGKVLDTLASFDVIDLEGSQPLILGTYVDITERKRAERQLREDEQRLRSILETALDGFWSFDPRGKLLEVNEAACYLSGYSRDELLEMYVWDLDVQESQDEIMEHIQRIISSGSSRFESIHRRKNGALFDVEISVTYSASQLEQIFCFVRDISERKRAERELRESQENLRALLDAIKESVLLIQPDGEVVIANQTVAARFGLSAEQLIGQNIFGMLPSETLATRQLNASEVIRSGKAAIFEDERAGRTILNSVAPVFGAQGQVERLAIVGFDITERKLAEEKVRASLREKETLLREVHHRVKNNLQAIIALLAMRGGQIEDAQVRQFLKELEGQARTMALVYEQLFASDNLARVAMAPYLQRLTANIIETFGRSQDVSLQLTLDPILMDVSIAMPCGLIVNELVTNMLKYAFPAGFEGAPLIRVELLQVDFPAGEGTRYHLEVADNGVGLAPGSESRPGRGLGLQLVRLWATHQLGGTLETRNQDGLSYTIVFHEEA